jgi:hypothetical protein
MAIPPSKIKLSKKLLGQFYTTNYDYILKNMTIPPRMHIIEPFAGNGELLNFIGDCYATLEAYDIDPKKRLHY